MSATAFSRLNPVVYTGRLQRVVAGRCIFKNLIPGEKGLFFSGLEFSHLARPSPGRRVAMAASGSLPVFGDACFDDLVTTFANGLDSATMPSASGGCLTTDRTRASCQRASMSIGKSKRAKSLLVCQHSAIVPLQKSSFRGSCFSLMSKNGRTSSTVCFSVGPAHELSFNSGSHDEDLTYSPPTSSLRNLKLLSGSCYLPHPAKEDTGGEDDHFICDEEQVIGVADGVGGWAEVGVNAGLFARELMSNSVMAIQGQAKGSSIDPLTVLEKAHAQTTAKGSSTACIITLTDKGIHAINLGDSGFIVVREGTTLFQSPVQQHGFNFTYQLESGNRGDMPSSGQVFTIEVKEGDAIVAGTDGLFDNLYNDEIVGVVVNSVRAGLDPKGTAEKIAELARQIAVDRNRQTPFSAAAQEAGYRYYGGKLDDITVVVSYIG
ncbi:PREDICTED: probable protein phosphatase 2C 80 [Tarenaya hassleriana]|uniref:probable protein phosphatase 2C 80 n=1 Tax=Tarenaya hassleriana TaxID=28532 RepID=UPI00053C5945|nr:PREDICTED: probable protein phosphatase 2C 80 [Tarenaya hassleriana]XP_010547494.1 PREDICTED: probable protein phosphatase 2C 80 [Tarenaya hassleriana]XP_010547495.1 PREDICTED: probable protein phosphatase 2C 80 [Tarenaya hassleriana]